MRKAVSYSVGVILLVWGSLAMGATLYVDAAGGGTYTSIQAAINAAAVAGDEIEVAPGTYYEAINFNGKAVRLYSHSGNPADTIINGTGNYHVVLCIIGEGPSTILEKFTITGGNASSGYPDNHGGGMCTCSSSPTVIGCVFSGNFSHDGGGMCNLGSSPTVTDCTFSGNSALCGGGMFNDGSSPRVTNCTFSGNSAAPGVGGGMYNLGSSPTVTDCTFSGNSGGMGGGMHNDVCSPTVINCVFSGNSAEAGGGMCNHDMSYPTVTNCVFSGNSALFYGGGMENTMDGRPSVLNCAFIGNSSGQGGGMNNRGAGSPTVTNCTFSGNSASFGGGMAASYMSYPTVTNCIFWSDSPCEIWEYDIEGWESFVSVSYSCVQGGYDGTGNISDDPFFIVGGGCRLQLGSPCIDTGSDSAVPSGITTDLDGNPRIQGAAVDMGAFEAPPATPKTMTAALSLLIIDRVDAGSIAPELEDALLAKVSAAIAALDRGNANDAKVAMNDLKALINQVEAQTDKMITAEAAALIIEKANSIITALGG